ncbi:hypothetical protein BC628DRAFT_915990 [Trametes gibbosa]|nr:hypothetical protein BC628DRAFT_915990 [Trametes gibbosa]
MRPPVEPAPSASTAPPATFHPYLALRCAPETYGAEAGRAPSASSALTHNLPYANTACLGTQARSHPLSLLRSTTGFRVRRITPPPVVARTATSCAPTLLGYRAITAVKVRLNCLRRRAFVTMNSRASTCRCECQLISAPPLLVHCPPLMYLRQGRSLRTSSIHHGIPPGSAAALHDYLAYECRPDKCLIDPQPSTRTARTSSACVSRNAPRLTQNLDVYISHRDACAPNEPGLRPRACPACTRLGRCERQGRKERAKQGREAAA